MTSVSFGDMASVLRNMRTTTQVKTDLENYNYEVSSGLKHDLRASVSGDFTPLASVERALRTISAYETSINEASLMATGAQVSLEAISTHVSDMAAPLLTAATSADATSVSVSATDARTRLDAVISAMNARISGRALFAGAATGQVPMITSDDMLTALQTDIAAAGATTADDVATVLDTWFNTAGGGFETLAYQGSGTPLSAMALSETESVSLELTAADPAFRDTLRGIATAALVAEGTLDGDLTQQTEMIRDAGEVLLGAESGLADIRAHVGSVEARIEEALLTNSAQGYAYESAKSDIVSADIYESAALLTQAESQLELIYTLTARLSRLSLSDYL